MAEAKTVVELFERRVRESGPDVALRYKEDGAWRTQSWNDWMARVDEVAAGCLSLGLAPGERACILANTRVEWFYCDIGIMFAGGVVVPIYQTNTPEQCAYIVNNSEAKILFVEDAAQLEKIKERRDELTTVKKVVYFQGDCELEKADARGRSHVRLADVLPQPDDFYMAWGDFQQLGRSALAKTPAAVKERKDAVKPDQPATFVYTSGTTGPPKGVVLTHDSIAYECNAVMKALTISPDDEQLLWLPLAHIFARILEFAAIATGAKTAFAESIPKIVENLGEVKPTFMGAVPRIYEKVYNGVIGKAQADGGLKLKIFDWAVGVGAEVSKLRQRGGEPSGLLAVKYGIASSLVFSKLKARFGGRIRFFVSGGAPLARKIAEFLHACGILVLEGYGLTETTAATHINRIEKFKFGTVGRALDGVDVKIAEDGEILVRGRNILQEYFKRPEDTAEVKKADGWFSTGDIGEIDAEGFLRITDRKKDLMKTAGGKYVAPQNIEGLLKTACKYISQAMVYGDQKPYLTAMITLDAEALKKWADEHAESGEYKKLTQLPAVRALVQEAINDINRGLAPFEQVKKFVIAEKDFTQEDGEMTPSLKVKRKAVIQKYQDRLEGMYGVDKSAM